MWSVIEPDGPFRERSRVTTPFHGDRQIAHPPAAAPADRITLGYFIQKASRLYEQKHSAVLAATAPTGSPLA